jgi:hypothetical protein
MKKLILLLLAFDIVISGDLDKNNSDKKSPAVAFGLSLIFPGLGQAYLKRFDIGRYFLASEVSLWLAYFGLNEYGRWLNDDAINFAVARAGIDKTGKDDDFFANIENYRSVYDFNQRKGRDRNYDKLYDTDKFFWWWDTDESRQRYKDIRTKSRAMRYYAKFALVFVISNHFASAIDAFVLAKKSNLKLGVLPTREGFNAYLSFNF